MEEHQGFNRCMWTATQSHTSNLHTRLQSVASHGVESTVPEQAFSDVQQLHKALPDLLARALEKQLASLMAYQNKQSSMLHRCEEQQKDIVSRLERLERDKDSKPSVQNEPSSMFCLLALVMCLL
eukprot:2669395-Amphidinium_carterae.1